MPRTRRHMKRNSPPNETNKSLSKKKKIAARSESKVLDGSSSESDIENYLKSASEIDLDSTFFKTTVVEKSSFADIEKNIFSGINCLSDSESNDELEENQQLKTGDNISNLSHQKQSSNRTTINFEHIHAYNKKLEDAKKHIDAYKARKETEEKNVDILNMLSIGESKTDDINLLSPSLQSSDFDTLSESEKEDWEEVHTAEENTLVPKKELQITVEIQGNVRKKKGIDLMDIIKRRLNRIKKDNQVFIHKVHLLCWIAHGNYINKILISENLMSLGLSLLPSQQCYPSERLNLGYLEDILQWYRKSIKIKERIAELNGTMEDLLEQQIVKKECYNYKMFVYIFILILRSLGIRCRLVLSLQVESLRPPQSELCSLSKIDSKSSKSKHVKSTSANVSHDKLKASASSSKKSSISTPVSTKKANQAAKKEISQVSTKKTSKTNIKSSNLANFEDMCVSLIGADNEEAGHDKSVRKIKNTTSRNLQKNEKNIVNAKNKNSQEISSKQQSKQCIDKKQIKSGKEKLISNQTNQNETTKKSQKKEPENKREKHYTEVKSSINLNSNSQRSTRQKKAFLSEIEEFSQNKTKNLSFESKNLIDEEDTSSSKRESESLPLKQSCRQSKSVKGGDVSNKTIYSSTGGESSKNLKYEDNLALNLKTKEKLIASKLNTKSHSSKQPSVENSSIQENTKGKEDIGKNVENKEKATSSKRTRKSVSPKESDSMKQNPNVLKMKMPFKLKSAPEKLKESIIKMKTDSIPNIVINKGDETETTDHEIIIPQVDGGNDTDSEDKPSKTKPNLRKLKTESINRCLTKEHPKRLQKLVDYKELNSDEDFDTRNSSTSRNFKSSNKKIKAIPDLKNLSEKKNLNKLKTSKKKLISQTLPHRDESKYFETRGQLDVRNDIINLVQQNLSTEKQTLRSKLVNHKRSSKSYTSDSDSDYIPEPKKKILLQDEFKEKTYKVKRRIPMKKDLIELEKKRQIEKEEQKKKKGINVWVEVFAEAEEKWISVDVVKGQVHCIKEINTRATHPISYILSWDNENHVKDITKRYCLNWNTVTRKVRVDSKWWERTLLPYKASSNVRDKEEDEDLARQQLEQPLPSTISEYKNHPLYVLKRHLLKFEGLYPPDALILGFVRSEPVYSRDCVHVLHSREIWLKHAKVVKLGETPYKIVKARPKYDKLSNSVITDKPLEIFGKWQVEDYVPPTAENGIVPRNAYGNVELFKSCMLPKGTVHLQLPALNKVAKKMNIDCAPAVVGFDFHGGWSHPTFDGFVVCEEYSEQLIAAWYTEQEESERKAQEKIEKRVYDNWRRLIKGLLIRERLKAKYDFGEISTKDGKAKKKGLTLKKGRVHSDCDSE